MSPPAVPLSTSPSSSPSSSKANNGGRGSISYADLMKPDEDWRVLPDAAERRKIQNRLAQRAYRRNMRDRTKELEKLKKELANLKGKKPSGGSSSNDAAAAAAAVAAEEASRHDALAAAVSPVMPASAFSPDMGDMSYDELHHHMQQQQHQHQQHHNHHHLVDTTAMVTEWSDSFPPPWAQGLDGVVDPAFFTCSPLPDDVTSPRSSSKKARGISAAGVQTPTPPRSHASSVSSSSTSSSSSSSSSSKKKSSRKASSSSGNSRHNTPLPSPSARRAEAAINSHNNMPPTPPPAGIMSAADLQQASQLLTMSPCEFVLGDHHPLDTMSLPQLDGSDPTFMDGFLGAQRSFSAPTTLHPDQGVWSGLASPPLGSATATFGSYLTPSPPAAGAANSPSSWPVTPGAAESSPIMAAAAPSGAEDAAIAGVAAAAQQQQRSCRSPFSSANSQFSTYTSASSSSRSVPQPTNKDSTATARSSLLHLAVAGGHSQVLRMLLQRCDLEIDSRDAAGFTPLQRAVMAGREELAIMLLEHGADPAAGRPDEMTGGGGGGGGGGGVGGAATVAGPASAH